MVRALASRLWKVAPEGVRSATVVKEDDFGTDGDAGHDAGVKNGLELGHPPTARHLETGQEGVPPVVLSRRLVTYSVMPVPGSASKGRRAGPVRADGVL